MSGNSGISILHHTATLQPANVRFRSLTCEEGVDNASGDDGRSSLTPTHTHAEQRDSIKALQNALRRSMTLNGVMDTSVMTSRDIKFGTLDLSESEGVSAGTSKSWMMNPNSRQYSLAGSLSAVPALPIGNTSAVPSASSSTIGSLSTLKLAPIPAIPKRTESINEAAEALRRFIRFSKATTGPQENLDALDASARNLLVLKLFRLLCKKHRDLKILQASRHMLDDRGTLSTPHTLTLPLSTPEAPMTNPVSEPPRPATQPFLLIPNPPRRKRHSRGLLSTSTGHRTEAPVSPQVDVEAGSTSSSDSPVQVAATHAIWPPRRSRSSRQTRGTQMSPSPPALIEVATSPLRHEVVPAAVQTFFPPQVASDVIEHSSLPLNPSSGPERAQSNRFLEPRGSHGRYPDDRADMEIEHDDGFVQEVKQLREFLDALQSEVQNLLPLPDVTSPLFQATQAQAGVSDLAGDSLQTAGDGRSSLGRPSRREDSRRLAAEALKTETERNTKSEMTSRKRSKRKRPRNGDSSSKQLIKTPQTAQQRQLESISPHSTRHLYSTHPLYHYTDYNSTETPPRYRDDTETEASRLPPKLHARETTSRVSTASLSTPPPLVEKRHQQRELPYATQTRRPNTSATYPSPGVYGFRSPLLSAVVGAQCRVPSCPVNPTTGSNSSNAPYFRPRGSPPLLPRRNSAGSTGGSRPTEPDKSETLPRPRRSKVAEPPEQWQGPAGETSDKWRFPRLSQAPHTSESQTSYTSQSVTFGPKSVETYEAPKFEYTSSMGETDTVLSPTSAPSPVTPSSKTLLPHEKEYKGRLRRQRTYDNEQADTGEEESPTDRVLSPSAEYEAVSRRVVRVHPVEAETDTSSPEASDMRRLLPPLKQSSSHSSSIPLENGWSAYGEHYAELSPSNDGGRPINEVEWSPMNSQGGESTPYFAAAETNSSAEGVNSSSKLVDGTSSPTRQRHNGRTKHRMQIASSSTDSPKSPLAAMLSPTRSRFAATAYEVEGDELTEKRNELGLYSPPPLSPSPSRLSKRETLEPDQFYSPSSVGHSLKARHWRKGEDEMMSPMSNELDDDDEYYQSVSTEPYRFHQEPETNLG